jgi:ubiquinone/menaquinone biosynthesis C-methylase UbiE
MALKRILEPEVMESAEDASEYDSMDFTDVNLAFALRALELASVSGKALDIGTGTARIPILMVQQARHDLVIHAVDLSNEMLKVGRKNVDASRLKSRIILQHVDAKRLPFSDHEFDMVVSNSLAHHIPDPEHFFKEAARVLRPDGGLLIRDLMRPETVEDVERIVEQYAGDSSAHQKNLYRESLLASLTVTEVESYVRAAGFRGVRVVQSSDRHWSAERPFGATPV